MLKKVGFTVVCMCILCGCNSSVGKRAGIELQSVPAARVFINGKEAGSTPYRNKNLMPGTVNIRMVADDLGQEWNKELELHNFTDTVVNVLFDQNSGAEYVLSLEPYEKNTSGLIVTSEPQGALVKLGEDSLGFTPLKVDLDKDGEAMLKVQRAGYKTMQLFVRLIPKYQLVMRAKLQLEPLPSPTDTPKEKIVEKMVVIKQTETGFLRVRADANSSSAEIAKVKPGEKYKLLEEKGDWIKVEISSSLSGWVSVKYTEKE